MPPIQIDLTSHQMKALKVRWNDWEVRILILMLGVVFGGTLTVIAIIAQA